MSSVIRESNATLESALARLGKAVHANQAKKDSGPAKVVQFPIPFPDNRPPVCNVIARSALFAAIKSKDRKQMKKQLIVSQDGVEIIFSGEQFNQDDHDTFMQLVKLASHRPLGEAVTVPANAILRALGRNLGKSQHQQLKADMYRLLSGTVEIRANGLYYGGHLVDDIAQDEREPAHHRHWVYRLNPKLVALFGRNQYTLIDWETRQLLKQKDLAKWLQLQIESHAQQYMIAVDKIRNRSGGKTVALKHFRAALKRALDDLKAIGVINDWEIDSGDLLHVKRSPSDSQVKHIRKKVERKKRDRDYADQNDSKKAILALV